MGRTNKDQKEAADAWLAWELLRRGVLLGCIPPMEQADIVEVCGFPHHQTLSQRVGKGLKKAKKLANPV